MLEHIIGCKKMFKKAQELWILLKTFLIRQKEVYPRGGSLQEQLQTSYTDGIRMVL